MPCPAKGQQARRKTVLAIALVTVDAPSLHSSPFLLLFSRSPPWAYHGAWHRRSRRQCW